MPKNFLSHIRWCAAIRSVQVERKRKVSFLSCARLLSSYGWYVQIRRIIKRSLNLNKKKRERARIITFFHVAFIFDKWIQSVGVKLNEHVFAYRVQIDCVLGHMTTNIVERATLSVIRVLVEGFGLFFIEDGRRGKSGEKALGGIICKEIIHSKFA